MTIGAHDLELIKKEVAGIREFYNARIDSEMPPIKEELERIAAQVTRGQEMWRDGEKQAILSAYGGLDRPKVPAALSWQSWQPWDFIVKQSIQPAWSTTVSA